MDKPTYVESWVPPPRGAFANNSSSSSSSSDGFHRSCPLDEDDFRESSHDLEVIHDPDLSTGQFRFVPVADPAPSRNENTVTFAAEANVDQDVSSDWDWDRESDAEYTYQFPLSNGLSTTALSAKTSHNENAVSPPTLPCGGSQSLEGNAVSPHSLDIFSPNASGDAALEVIDEDDHLDEELWAELEKDLDEDTQAVQDKESPDPAEKEAAKSAPRAALLQEELRIAAEKAAEVPKRADFEAERAPIRQDEPGGTPYAEGAAGTLEDGGPSIDDMIAHLPQDMDIDVLPALAEAESICEEVRRMKAPRKSSPRKSPDPLSRAERGPVRRTEDLPRLYHHGHSDGIDLKPLMKHMVLLAKINTSLCYRSLGLDSLRGKRLSEKIKDYLSVPGNSVRLPNKNPDDATKLLIAKLAHELLHEQGWGKEYFSRPSLQKGCKEVTWGTESTEIFLEFTSLVYKIAKHEEQRRNAKAKTREQKDANNASQHPTTAAFAYASPDYASPQYVATSSQTMQQASEQTMSNNNNNNNFSTMPGQPAAQQNAQPSAPHALASAFQPNAPGQHSTTTFAPNNAAHNAAQQSPSVISWSSARARQHPVALQVPKNPVLDAIQRARLNAQLLEQVPAMPSIPENAEVRYRLTIFDGQRYVQKYNVYSGPDDVNLRLGDLADMLEEQLGLSRDIKVEVLTHYGLLPILNETAWVGIVGAVYQNPMQDVIPVKITMIHPINVDSD